MPVFAFTRNCTATGIPSATRCTIDWNIQNTPIASAFAAGFVSGTLPISRLVVTFEKLICHHYVLTGSITHGIQPHVVDGRCCILSGLPNTHSVRVRHASACAFTNKARSWALLQLHIRVVIPEPSLIPRFFGLHLTRVHHHDIHLGILR